MITTFLNIKLASDCLDEVVHEMERGSRILYGENVLWEYNLACMIHELHQVSGGWEEYEVNSFVK